VTSTRRPCDASKFAIVRNGNEQAIRVIAEPLEGVLSSWRWAGSWLAPLVSHRRAADLFDLVVRRITVDLKPRLTAVRLHLRRDRESWDTGKQGLTSAVLGLITSDSRFERVEELSGV
jgi:hypothetical protein